MEIKEILTLASTDILQFDVCVCVCVYKHSGMDLKKGNTEHYVGLINNQITDFYRAFTYKHVY